MMNCDKCGKTFDDDDGQMYVYNSKISDAGSPYIWICKCFDSTLDERKRDDIYRMVHLNKKPKEKKRHWWQK